MRRLKSTIAVLVALGLLVGALWLGDGWARQQVEERIVATVATELPEVEGDVQAELGGRFAIPQLIGGTLETVTVTSPEAVIDSLALRDVVIVAHGVPIRGSGSIAEVTATGSAPTATVLSAIERRVELPDGVSLELRDGEIVAVASILGVPLEGYVTLVPQPRAIEVSVERLVLGDATVDAADIPFDLSGLLDAATVDLEMLPEGVELIDLVVTPAGIEVTLHGTDVALS